MVSNHVLAARLMASNQSEGAASQYRILIRDLVLDCWIGVYEDEKNAPQRVRFNIEIVAREANEPLGDDIAKVISYDDILSDIRALISRGHINLVETLAEEVAQICLSHEQAIKATVRIEKLDIEAAAEGVGVEIERRRTERLPHLYRLNGLAAGRARSNGGHKGSQR